MSEKRILITEVSGECHNLRIQQDPFDDKPGTYCAAYIHGGWERIDPKECDTCKREKYLTGISRQEAIEKMAKAMCQRDESGVGDCANCGCRNNKTACKFFLSDEGFFEMAEAALDELLGKESV